MCFMQNKIKSLLKGKGGFTLIELIVVIGIMGFLVAMIAPRIAGVMAGSADAVCDSNQVRLQQVMGAYTEKNNNIPNMLTGLIIEKADIPVGSPESWADDNNKRNGSEIMSADFVHGAELQIHRLSQGEVDELAQLGITGVFNLNLHKGIKEYNGVTMNWNASMPESADVDPHMEKLSPLAAGTPVLIIGAGAPDATSNIPALVPANFNNTKFKHPDKIYRIVLGVGPDSDLIKDGLITKAGMCPAGMQREGHFAYNNYNIVLPRLQATVDRITTANITATEGNTGRVQTIGLNEAQESWAVTTFCPEGDTVAGTGGPFSIAVN